MSEPEARRGAVRTGARRGSADSESRTQAQKGLKNNSEVIPFGDHFFDVIIIIIMCMCMCASALAR